MYMQGATKVINYFPLKKKKKKVINYYVQSLIIIMMICRPSK